MDVTAVDARLVFDCGSHTAFGSATMSFVGDGQPGYWDLRQHVDAAWLDGTSLPVSGLEPNRDGVRVVEAGDGAHELVVRYPLATPVATDAVPLGWTLQRPGLLFDFWMSDLYPGRYLEMWVPSPLCHDQFSLSVTVEVVGAGPHRVFANGAVSGDGSRVDYPASFTSLSPMLVIAPDDRYDLISTVEDGLTVDTFKFSGPEIDLAACHVTVAECLAHNRSRFGPYGHGSRFLTYVWGSSRGMEYDGATTASVASLEHEVFHSWFGRGVKPATASDGWIDEAFTSWYTSPPARGRQWAAAFDWSEPPVLLCPASPLARFTPRESYTSGARFFAGVADVLGVDGLCDGMGRLYRERVGGFVSTAELSAWLSSAGGFDFGPAFARWIHGEDVR